METYLKDIDSLVRPQPFVLILGPSRFRPTQSFVVMERRAIPADTIVKAVDLCFKIHYIFNLKFQSQCQAVWQFLEMLVYDIACPSKQEVIASVRDFSAFHNFMQVYQEH